MVNVLKFWILYFKIKATISDPIKGKEVEIYLY